MRHAPTQDLQAVKACGRRGISISFSGVVVHKMPMILYVILIKPIVSQVRLKWNLWSVVGVLFG